NPQHSRSYHGHLRVGKDFVETLDLGAPLPKGPPPFGVPVNVEVDDGDVIAGPRKLFEHPVMHDWIAVNPVRFLDSENLHQRRTGTPYASRCHSIVLRTPSSRPTVVSNFRSRR